MGIYKMNHRIT